MVFRVPISNEQFPFAHMEVLMNCNGMSTSTFIHSKPFTSACFFLFFSHSILQLFLKLHSFPSDNFCFIYQYVLVSATLNNNEEGERTFHNHPLHFDLMGWMILDKPIISVIYLAKLFIKSFIFFMTSADPWKIVFFSWNNNNKMEEEVFHQMFHNRIERTSWDDSIPCLVKLKSMSCRRTSTQQQQQKSVYTLGCIFNSFCLVCDIGIEWNIFSGFHLCLSIFCRSITAAQCTTNTFDLIAYFMPSFDITRILRWIIPCERSYNESWCRNCSTFTSIIRNDKQVIWMDEEHWLW